MSQMEIISYNILKNIRQFWKKSTKLGGTSEQNVKILTKKKCSKSKDLIPFHNLSQASDIS